MQFVEVTKQLLAEKSAAEKMVSFEPQEGDKFKWGQIFFLHHSSMIVKLFKMQLDNSQSGQVLQMLCFLKIETYFVK